MVSQEPVLFNSTIRYNIKYNKPEITDEQMINAATVANATKFINIDSQDNQKDDVDKINTLTVDDNDGSGYDRKVGLKGNKLSGG